MILGNGPAAKGAHGESHEPHGIVIRCNPVGAYLAADRAPVQDGPFAVFSHPHADGLHAPAAVGFTVTGLVVQVDAPEAVGAVVSVAASGSLGDHRPAADPAGERIRAGMGFVISFVVFSSLIFTIHFHNLR